MVGDEEEKGGGQAGELVAEYFFRSSRNKIFSPHPICCPNFHPVSMRRLVLPLLLPPPPNPPPPEEEVGMRLEGGCQG